MSWKHRTSPRTQDTFTTTYSSLKNQFLQSIRYREYVQFILGALAQYLFEKLEKKINYTNSKFSRKLPAYWKKLPAFSVKLPTFYDKLSILDQISKINFKEA